MMMRVGIIGSGSMGAAHAAGWAATPATIAGFLDGGSGAAAKLAAEYGGQVYPNLPALLAAVDVVSLCTPTHLHHEQALLAAEAGKHIVIEKPLALSVEQGEAIIRACESAGVRLLMAHVLRFFPHYAHIRQMIAADDIGQPDVLNLFRRSAPPARGWFLDSQRSGGVMLDLMIHDLDYARWLAGEVAEVSARTHGQHALVTLAHTSGALSHIEASWGYPFFWTGVTAAGETGFIDYDSREAGVRLYRSSEVLQANIPTAENPYIVQIKTFYAALTSGVDVPVTPLDGLAALTLARAAIASAANGQPIRLLP